MAHHARLISYLCWNTILFPKHLRFLIQLQWRGRDTYQISTQFPIGDPGGAPLEGHPEADTAQNGARADLEVPDLAGSWRCGVHIASVGIGSIYSQIVYEIDPQLSTENS